MWIWDLALTCNNSTINGDNDLFWGGSGCNCSFAEELLENGLLACEDAALCPDDCEVCSTCLELLGCGDGKPPGVMEYLSRPVVLYVLAAAVALLIFAAAAHYSRKKWKPRGGQLNQNLLIDSATKPSLEITPASVPKKKKRRQPPSFTLYIRASDLSWRPLPSDEEYAASQQLQQTGTMSTVSTGRQYLAPPSDCGSSSNSYASARSRIETGDSPTDSDSRLHGEKALALDTLFNNTQTEAQTGNAFVPPVVDTFLQMNNSGGVTSYSVSPMPTQEEEFSDEETTTHPAVFEDVSPRTMCTETGEDEATEKL